MLYYFSKLIVYFSGEFFMSITAATFTNPLVTLYQNRDSIKSSVVASLSHIKNDPDAIQHVADIGLEALKGSTSPTVGIFQSVTASQDNTGFFRDVHHFTGGGWREASIYNNLQMATFVVIDTFTLVAAASSIGLFSIVDLADKLGGASSLAGGVLLTATGTNFLVGAAAVGFTWYAADTFIKYVNVENNPNARAVPKHEAAVNSTYYALVLGRCTTKIGACGLFLYAATTPITLVSAGTVAFGVSALTVTSLFLALTASLFKRANAGTIDKYEEKLSTKDSYEKHTSESYLAKLPSYFQVNTNGFFAKAQNYVSGATKAAETFTGTIENQEKADKGISSLFSCSQALATLANGTILDNSFLQWISSNEGVKALADECKNLSTIFSGIKFFDRLNERYGLDGKGQRLSAKWTEEKKNNRSFLTGAHFMDLLKLLKMAGLELSFLSAKTVFKGVTFKVEMLKEVLVIGASYFGYKNADAELKKNAIDRNNAGSSLQKAIERYNTGFSETSYIGRQSPNEDGSYKKVKANGKEVPISRAAYEKRRYLLDENNKVDVRKKLDKKELAWSELNKSWSSYFRGTEIRKLSQEIDDCKAIQKVYDWYDANKVNQQPLYDSFEVTLPAGKVLNTQPIVKDGKILHKAILPKDTVVFVNNKEITLKYDIIVNTATEGRLVNGWAVFDYDASNFISNELPEKDAKYAFKNLAKALRYEENQNIYGNLKGLLKEKGAIAKRYEPCKIAICAMGLAFAATSAPALAPVISIWGAVVSALDIHKSWREKQIEARKNSDPAFKLQATAAY